MNFFLHIKITEVRLNFNNEVLSVVKSRAPEVSCFDLDNSSDILTIETALKALKQADKSLIYIEASPEPELKRIMKLLQYFARPANPLKIVYSGSHPLLDKMMPAFGDRIAKGDVKILEQALEWLEDSPKHQI